MKSLRASCNLGAGEGCYKLAVETEKSAKDDKGWRIAINAHQSACDKGIGAACNALGVMAGSGKGFVKDGQVMKRFFEQACDRNSATGCYNLSNMLSAGALIPADKSAAQKAKQKGAAIDAQAGSSPR